MSSRLVAALLGIVGGLVLTAAGGLSFLMRESPAWQDSAAIAGYSVTILALVAMGYALASQAPVWLRIIVSVAYPLLIASVWQVVDQAVDDRMDGWKGPATVHLLGGVIVVIAALLGFRRSGRNRADSYAPTHHR